MAREARMEYDSSRLIDNWTNGSGGTLNVGSVIALSDRIGVLQQTVLDGGKGVVVCSGRWAMALKSGDTPAVGDRVYWDDTNKEITVTSTDNVNAGVVVPGHNLASGEVCVDIAM